MSRIVQARLDELSLPLVEPFETSFGVQRRRRFLVISLDAASGVSGLAECAAEVAPLYSEETIDSARAIVVRQLLPVLWELSDVGPREFNRATAPLRGNRMAKAVVEQALWDMAAKEKGTSLARLLGGRRERVEVGVSVGIQRDAAATVRRVAQYLDDGYRRIKLKVAPGRDEVPVAAVRAAFPDVRLWVDANAAYRLSARTGLARWLTREQVEQVEQPFEDRAIRAHALLQRGQRFRVCLDESVVDAPSLEEAISGRALRALNIKPGRVGGHAASLDLARRASRSGVLPWVGGMLESGIGRAHNVALAAGAPFVLPGDLSASDRYYAEEIVDAPFRLDRGSRLAVPRGPGIGVELHPARYRHALRRSRSYRP